MSLKDRFSRKKKAAVPRGANVVQRKRRDGRGTDPGYWDGGSFFLLDGSVPDTSDYLSGWGDPVTSGEVASVLENNGYDASSYDSGSGSSYDSGSSYTAPDPSPSYDSGSSSSSYDSGSSSSYDSGSSW